jgi:hypothetical protein
MCDTAASSGCTGHYSPGATSCSVRLAPPFLTTLGAPTLAGLRLCCLAVSMLPSFVDARRAGVAATTRLLLLLLLLLRPGRCLAEPAGSGAASSGRSALHESLFLLHCAAVREKDRHRGLPVLRHASLVGGSAGASACSNMQCLTSNLPDSRSLVAADTSNAVPNRDKSISARIAGAEADQRPAALLVYLHCK